MSKYKVNNTASVYVSAAHKSSGKTIISLGLSRIFSDLNHNIQTFKKGPDYIDMGWLSFASRKNSYNLDFNTQTPKEIKDLYDNKKTNINLIEGNKGLYDGVNLHGKDDNSAMSILLGVPVILVIDTQGITRGIAPLLQGYVNFEKKCNIQGIILNKVSTERHESKLINSVENYTDLKILGSVRKNKDLVISERHLGLIPANEKKVVEKKINAISNIISDSISKKEFSELGISFKKKKTDKKIVQNVITEKLITKIKIGVFYDSSFGFYYADDIENLKKYGAEIVYINAVKNKKIPNVDAIFIGGGFPEINAEKLSKNKILMLNLKNFIEEEKPCYAECGGLMYLSESIKYNSKKYKMVGIIPGCINMSKKPIGRGYVQLEVKKNHLWNSAPTEIINAHEFHHANLILNKGVKNNFCYNVKRGYGINGKSDGYMYKKLLANFTHLRNTDQYPWIKYFINFIKESKND